MKNGVFRVAVTGDTGYDVYTEYVEAYESEDNRLQKPEAAYDVYVPSGAAFTNLAFKSLLFPRTDAAHVEVEYLQPKEAYELKNQERIFSTLQKFLIELFRFRDNASTPRRVLRVKQARPILDKEIQLKADVFSTLVNNIGDKPKNWNYDLLVIHDGAGNWRHYPKRQKGKPPGDALDLVQTVLKKEVKHGGPRIIVNLNHDLPDVKCSKDDQVTFVDEHVLWHELAKPDNIDKVCVVCSVNMLRREGAAISRRLSFEQTVEDIVSDLKLFEKLSVLSSFKHLIIRLSLVGVVHIMNDKGKRTADLVFAPLAKGGVYRDPAEDGTIEGQNAILAAALTQMVLTQPKCDRSAFLHAMQSGLSGCMLAFDNGFHVSWDEAGIASSLGDGEAFIKNLLIPSNNPSARDAVQRNSGEPHHGKLELRRDHVLGHVAVPGHILDRTSIGLSQGNAKWELLRDAIDPGDSTPTISRINVGVAIVLFGHDRVLNCAWNVERTEDGRYCNDDDAHIVKVLNRPDLVTSIEESKDYTTLSLGMKPSLPSGSRQLSPSHWITRPIYGSSDECVF